jgi:hypothetical protein
LLHQSTVRAHANDCFDGRGLAQRTQRLPLKIDYDSLPIFFVAGTGAHRGHSPYTEVIRTGALKINPICNVDGLPNRRRRLREPVGNIIVGLFSARNLDQLYLTLAPLLIIIHARDAPWRVSSPGNLKLAIALPGRSYGLPNPK